MTNFYFETFTLSCLPCIGNYHKKWCGGPTKVWSSFKSLDAIHKISDSYSPNFLFRDLGERPMFLYLLVSIIVHALKTIALGLTVNSLSTCILCRLNVSVQGLRLQVSYLEKCVYMWLFKYDIYAIWVTSAFGVLPGIWSKSTNRLVFGLKQPCAYSLYRTRK